MTPDEFQQWITHHRNLHPSYAEWTSTLSKDSKEAIATEWRNILEGVDLESAKMVSSGMLSGRYEHPPRWDYQRLASIVRDLAKASEPSKLTFRLSGSNSRTGREERFRCLHCRDTGFRTIYHPDAALRLMRGELDVTDDWQARRIHTANVLCDCDAGQHVLDQSEQRPDSEQKKWRWEDHHRFDPLRHCDCPMGDTEKHVNDLVEWCLWRRSQRRHNYEPAFAEFNERGQL